MVRRLWREVLLGLDVLVGDLLAAHDAHGRDGAFVDLLCDDRHGCDTLVAVAVWGIVQSMFGRDDVPAALDALPAQVGHGVALLVATELACVARPAG